MHLNRVTQTGISNTLHKDLSPCPKKKNDFKCKNTFSLFIFPFLFSFLNFLLKASNQPPCFLAKP